MPTKRARLSRRPKPGLRPELFARLRDLPCPPGGNRFTYGHTSLDLLRELWEEHEADVLAEWVERSPGTRPTLWWRFRAPEQRLRGESESAYLRRHGLLLEREGARLNG